MKWVLLLLALALATQVWLAFRVGRSNKGLAIATFFLGPVGALITLMRHRNEEETSVTVPFVANLLFTLLFLGAVWWIVMPALEAQERELQATFGSVGVAPVAKPPASAASAAVATASAAASAVTASASASAPVAIDPVDAFSQALNASGLAHVVTRLSDSNKLPAGVTGGALFSVVPVKGSAASAAPATSGYAATLFICESAAACRNLAGAQMQQSGPEKRRVLQNDLLLLSTPPVVADDPDLTPTAVASTFRKL